MSARRITATALRVLGQLRHDPRTVALVLVVPCVLLALLESVLEGTPGVFQSAGLSSLGIFPFVTMFVVTSIAMLRERTSGTLERLMAGPLHKLELLAGYGLAFAVLGTAQAVLVSVVGLRLLGLEVAGGADLVVAVAVCVALLGMALGLLASAIASTEFQAVQLMPAFVGPQVLLCGLLVPRELMAEPLQWASDALPLTYAVEAMGHLASVEPFSDGLGFDLAVVVVTGLAALGAGALTLRRRTG